MRTLLAVTILALSAGPTVAAEEEERGHVDVVFCVDRSGSMSAVIQTAKQKVWSIVNEVAKSMAGRPRSFPRSRTQGP